MKQRFKLTRESARFFEFIKSLGIKCEMILTNYTAEIRTENNQFKHIKNEKSVNVFVMAKRIIKDINRSQLDLGFDAIPSDDLNAGKVSFYRTGNLLHGHSSVWCIDIKSAYPQVLINHKFITTETHERLMKLKKEDRLAAIGFLASKKHIFEIDNGQIENFYITRSEYEKYFYFCANKIDQLMQELAEIVQEHFVFSWVDCIYISGHVHVDKVKEVQSHIEKKGYKYSTEVGRQFDLKSNERNFHISFLNEKGKVKVFKFPKNNSEFINLITQAVVNGKYYK